MATIHYSVSGEGRGHASRARVLIERLRPAHRIVVHCYGDAEALLAPLYRGTEVSIQRIPGLRFAYDGRGHLDRSGSLFRAMPFLWRLREETRRLARRLEADRADLALVDFEPLLPRAARLAGIPVMAVDHQQFLTACDLSMLPWSLRSGAAVLARFVRHFYDGPLPSVISSFFFPPLQERVEDVLQAGVLLRSEFSDVRPESGQHLVAYVRRHPPDAVLSALRNCRLPVRVYGAAAQGTCENLSFRAVSTSGFAEDLAGAIGLVSTAGNQVVGEALSLKKPVLAYPEPGNIEQSINAHFIDALRVGRIARAGEFTADLVHGFVRDAPLLAAHIDARRIDGTPVVLRAIDTALSGARLRPMGSATRPSATPVTSLSRGAIAVRPGTA